MTQFTDRFNVTVRDEFDHCEHVVVGGKAFRAIYESDCCGPVGVYACCKECSEALDKQEEEELVTCDDCGQEFQRKDTHEWKPYDFYAPQGDEPMVICNTCRTAEKHLARCRKDRADYNAEFGIEDKEPEGATEQFFGEQANRLTEDECQLDSSFFAEPSLVPMDIPLSHPETIPDPVILKDVGSLEKFKKFIEDERLMNGDQLNFIKPTAEQVEAVMNQSISEEEKVEFRKRWNLDV